MSKTCVVTLAVGENYQNIGSVTHPSIKAYADKIGSDFVVWNDLTITSSTAHWEKFKIYDLLNKYERVIYIDTDIIVRPDAPNLFDIVPVEEIGLFNEGAFVDRSYAMTLARDEYGISLDNWDGRYYNTGVMVISRRHKHIFRKPEKEINHFWEQTYINLAIHKFGVKVYQLPYKFNRMTILDPKTGEERHASYFIHYAGANCNNIDLVSLIKKDLKKWDETGPEYKYKRHILFKVGGGLGDEVDAEPVIRFALNNVWKGEDIRVAAHHPELFKHLPCPVYSHSSLKLEPDCPYYVMETMPDADKGILWAYLSNLLCHTVDFTAINCLRRTLPDADKQIILKTTFEDLTEVFNITGQIKLNESVLVHAGRHWESKTFPVEYWQEIIDGIHAAGKQVILIGKNDDNRGSLPVVAREGMIDLRDLTSLESLIALISQAGVLISNDSAPVHIAGAFDNWILLIPTCKHPDHILPWRKGDKYYKATALYKKLTLEDVPAAPTHVEGSLGDKVSGNFLDYLPEPKDVINKTIEILKTLE